VTGCLTIIAADKHFVVCAYVEFIAAANSDKAVTEIFEQLAFIIAFIPIVNCC
jgi:hypothetical protein